MCGLVGVSGIILKKQEDAFKTLLILDALRGVDSTGAALVSKDGDVDVVKVLGNPYELLDYKPFERRMARGNKTLIGHNRYGTQGVISRKNAHPFDLPNIVGAHNGTLTNKYSLRGHDHHDVDSHALFSHMDEHGVEVTVPLLRGAWSLTWYDRRDESINFIRNKERPMYIVSTLDSKTLLWASEKWMLDVACSRNDLKIGEITKTEENMLYSIQTGTLEVLLCKKIEGAPEVSNVYGGSHNGSFIGGRWVSNYQQQQQKKPDPETTSVLPNGRVVHFPVNNQVKEVEKELGKSESTGLGNGFIPGYSGSKGVTLEVINQGVSKEGATFLICFDPETPTAHIRLFLKKSDNPEKYIDREIIGDIGKYYVKTNDLTKGFYKVEYSSHKMAQKLEEFPDPKGRMIPANEWINRHGCCSWCTSPIFPTDSYTFTKQGDDTLCEDCSTNPEVKPYI